MQGQQDGKALKTKDCRVTVWWILLSVHWPEQGHLCGIRFNEFPIVFRLHI